MKELLFSSQARASVPCIIYPSSEGVLNALLIWKDSLFSVANLSPFNIDDYLLYSITRAAFQGLGAVAPLRRGDSEGTWQLSPQAGFLRVHLTPPFGSSVSMDSSSSAASALHDAWHTADLQEKESPIHLQQPVPLGGSAQALKFHHFFLSHCPRD